MGLGANQSDQSLPALTMYDDPHPSMAEGQLSLTLQVKIGPADPKAMQHL